MAKKDRQFWESATLNNTNFKQYYNRLTELSISRSIVKCWRSHPHKYVIAKNDAITDIRKLFERAEYYGWAEDEQYYGPNGSVFKKHPEVKYWKYYRVKIYDEVSYICVQVTNEGLNVPYCINDQKTWVGLEKLVKKTEPPK